MLDGLNMSPSSMGCVRHRSKPASLKPRARPQVGAAPSGVERNTPSEAATSADLVASVAVERDTSPDVATGAELVVSLGGGAPPVVSLPHAAMSMTPTTAPSTHILIPVGRYY